MNLIGIDLGGTRIKIGLVAEGRCADQRCDGSRGRERTTGSFAVHQRPYPPAHQADAHRGSLRLNMAFPGLVDTHTNQVISVGGKYEDAPTSTSPIGLARNWV